MLMTIEQANERIAAHRPLFIAGEEALLRRLNQGLWVAGTIPYFMDDAGGVVAQDRVFVTEVPEVVTEAWVKVYDRASLSQIPSDAPENGFSFVVLPAESDVHVAYAQDAPNFPGLYLKPIFGWIAGVHLSNVGKESPCVVDGTTHDVATDKAVVMHCALPAGKHAKLGVLNLFAPGDGKAITFDQTGFSAKDARIGGETANLAKYFVEQGVDTKLPLVADYSGVHVNVSIQSVDEAAGVVNFYAPVFEGVEYHLAAPVGQYVEQFEKEIPRNVVPAVSCNCILNFLYSELEGKKTGAFRGPMTFGEIGYQLLNQTMVYIELIDV